MAGCFAFEGLHWQGPSRAALGQWSNWTRFEEAHLTVEDVEETLPFEWNDGWFFSLGGEFDVTDRLALRAGIGYELSPLDGENRSYRLPDNDRLWLRRAPAMR
jgi:long-chain fatty acid transport protein